MIAKFEFQDNVQPVFKKKRNIQQPMCYFTENAS